MVNIINSTLLKRFVLIEDRTEIEDKNFSNLNEAVV